MSISTEIDLLITKMIIFSQSDASFPVKVAKCQNWKKIVKWLNILTSPWAILFIFQYCCTFLYAFIFHCTDQGWSPFRDLPCDFYNAEDKASCYWEISTMQHPHCKAKGRTRENNLHLKSKNVTCSISPRPPYTAIETNYSCSSFPNYF